MQPIIESLPTMIDAINKEVDTFNATIKGLINAQILARKEQIELKRKQNDDLNNF